MAKLAYFYKSKAKLFTKKEWKDTVFKILLNKYPEEKVTEELVTSVATHMEDTRKATFEELRKKEIAECLGDHTAEKALNGIITSEGYFFECDYQRHTVLSQALAENWELGDINEASSFMSAYEQKDFIIICSYGQLNGHILFALEHYPRFVREGIKEDDYLLDRFKRLTPPMVKTLIEWIETHSDRFSIYSHHDEESKISLITSLYDIKEKFENNQPLFTIIQ